MVVVTMKNSLCFFIASTEFGGELCKHGKNSEFYDNMSVKVLQLLNEFGQLHVADLS